MDAGSEGIKNENAVGLSDAQTDARVKKMLVTLRDDDLTAEIFASKSGIDSEQAEKIVRRNRRAIARRGTAIKIKDEIGQHLEALNALYTSAVQAQDIKTALSVEKEIGKTLSLYNKVEETEKQSVDPEKEEARAILKSALGTDTKIERLDDLARAVVNRLVESETRRK